MSFHPKRILAATDFSAGAQVAVDAAIDLAKQFQAQLTLVHVIPTSAYVDFAASLGGQTTGNLDFAEAVQAGAQARWATELLRLAPTGVAVEYLTRGGSPAQEVVAAVQEGSFGLVVVGTHGRTGLKHVLLGSVAESIVRHCPAPVLTFRTS